MAIETVEFELSLRDHETGEYLTARTYTVEGVTNVDGTPRQLSIGQLVMAICLKRATELEAKIIALMEEMNTTSAKLEAMTEIENEIVKWPDELRNEAPPTRSFSDYSVSNDNAAYGGQTFKAVLDDLGVIDPSVSRLRVSGTSAAGDIMYDDFITALEAKMDENNSFSQQKMIELQSQTSKRDQSYDMISNMLKSFNTVQVGIVNNI